MIQSGVLSGGSFVGDGSTSVGTGQAQWQVSGCTGTWQWCTSWRRGSRVSMIVSLSQATHGSWSAGGDGEGPAPVSYTHLRAHETPEHLVCRLLLEKKKKTHTWR
eukprot:TRINITY_DN45948_c0_g1_i1.p2 TRINITY_DN45948_c0_g1~~TRINITY_DN45948_c0_g1_i1.p2  ORF type:complete len:105 (+),score=13.71 TRINITY_DN45948_c0_g1_i1:232-546(+)